MPPFAETDDWKWEAIYDNGSRVPQFANGQARNVNSLNRNRSGRFVVSAGGHQLQYDVRRRISFTKEVFEGNTYFIVDDGEYKCALRLVDGAGYYYVFAQGETTLAEVLHGSNG